MSSVDGVFLRDGWEEFVKAHSLKENEILFFKYDRNSSFDVKIFNGQCEKEAAYFVKKCDHVNPAVKNQKRKVSSEIADGTSNGEEVCNTTKKARNKVRTPPLNDNHQEDGLQHNIRASKKVLSRHKTNQLALQFLKKKAASRSSKELQGRSLAEPALVKDTDQNGSTNKEASSGDQIQPEVNEICTPDAATFQKVIRKGGRPKRPPNSKKKTYAIIEYVSHRRQVTEEEKKAALQKAASELADKSFYSALPASSCYKGFFMRIPSKFACEHFHCRNEDVILRVGGMKWLTRYCFSTDKLASGWKQFALDNHLEEFDVCLFKLISKANDETMMFDVTIFRVVEEVTPPTILIPTPTPLLSN